MLPQPDVLSEESVCIIYFHALFSNKAGTWTTLVKFQYCTSLKVLCFRDSLVEAGCQTVIFSRMLKPAATVMWGVAVSEITNILICLTVFSFS